MQKNVLLNLLKKQIPDGADIGILDPTGNWNEIRVLDIPEAMPVMPVVSPDPNNPSKGKVRYAIRPDILKLDIDSKR